MLLDPRFAAAVRAGASSGLDPAGERLVRDADPTLVAADPDGRRVQQLLGNVALELLHTVRAAPPFLDDFPASPELHTAIRDDRPLPLAFAAFADRVLPEGPWRALLTLDTAMAEVRRHRGADPPRGLVDLAPATRCLDLPDGTLAVAEALRNGIHPLSTGPGGEMVVIAGRGPPGLDRPLLIERVSDAIADLLISCPLDQDAILAFMARHDAGRDDVIGLVDGLVADGVLVVRAGWERSISM
jgi:hypothetical protein